MLLGVGGPFALCIPERHSPIKPLHTGPVPEGAWDDEPDGESLLADSPYQERER